MEDLKAILCEIKKFEKELNFDFTDDTILDCATRIFNSNNIERGKGKGIDYDKPIPKATKKQLDYLKVLKYKGDVTKLNKIEARALIEKLVNGK